MTHNVNLTASMSLLNIIEHIGNLCILFKGLVITAMQNLYTCCVDIIGNIVITEFEIGSPACSVYSLLGI